MAIMVDLLLSGSGQHIASQSCTVPEAARLLQVSQTTIWRWIASSKLPAYRIGPRRIRIRREDLQRVIRPVERRERATGKHVEARDIWAGYDPEAVKEAIAKTAGSWADLDTEAIVADIYRSREQGSRPGSRP